jgi:hypothetical protein
MGVAVKSSYEVILIGVPSNSSLLENKEKILDIFMFINTLLM